MQVSQTHSHADVSRGTARDVSAVRADIGSLRVFAIAAGISCSVLFVVLGLRYTLQTYGDGSLFSYSVAVQDAWAFHWHNLSERLTVYFLSLLPAEGYVALTGDPGGGIAVYGLLFFSAQFAGLMATLAADRSNGRIVFAYACFSTALLCPLVFGFPTEMWMAHALFWPALALCHDARQGVRGGALVFAALLALIFTHEGGLVLACAIMLTLVLRGVRDPAFVRGACALIVAVSIWVAVRILLQPSGYFAGVLSRAEQHFFDFGIFTGDLLLLLFAAVAGYGALFIAVRRLTPANAHVVAASIVAVALAIYWLAFDHALHAANRYYLRTILVIATPGFGVLAALYALRAGGRLVLPVPLLQRCMDVFASRAAAQAIAGGFALVMLVHAVETTKFIAAWAKYKTAVRALAVGQASDPALGDARFVSSRHIEANASQLSWRSTTPYLSVIAADFAPARLVINPAASYFWFSCATATENARARRATPRTSRELVRIYECQHR